MKKDWMRWNPSNRTGRRPVSIQRLVQRLKEAPNDPSNLEIFQASSSDYHYCFGVVHCHLKMVDSNKRWPSTPIRGRTWRENEQGFHFRWKDCMLIHTRRERSFSFCDSMCFLQKMINGVWVGLPLQFSDFERCCDGSCGRAILVANFGTISDLVPNYAYVYSYRWYTLYVQ